MRHILIVAVAAALAACSPSAPKGEAPEAAAPPAAAKMKPGEWRTTVTMVDMAMEGMPAGMARKFRMEPIVTIECVSGDKIDDFVNKRSSNEPGAACTMSDVNTSGGRFAAKTTCTGAGGARTVAMSGVYGESKVELDMDMTGDTPSGPMSAKMHMLSERTGDCPAGK